MNRRMYAAALSGALVVGLGALITVNLTGPSTGTTAPTPILGASSSPAPPRVADVNLSGKSADPAVWARFGFGTASEVEHYDDVATMAKNVTVVVDAEVVKVAPTRLVGREDNGEEGDPGVQYYGLELKVNKVLVGKLWTPADTQGHTIVEVFGAPGDVSGEAPMKGVFFLTHKSDRTVPSQKDLPSNDQTAPAGEEKYYRFVSSQGLLVKDDKGSPIFPLSLDDDTNRGVRESVAGRSYDEVVARIS